ILAFIDHLQESLNEPQGRSIDQLKLILLCPGIELGTRRWTWWRTRFCCTSCFELAAAYNAFFIVRDRELAAPCKSQFERPAASNGVCLTTIHTIKM